MTTKKTIYFSRVKGLSAVVWDPEKDKALAEFDKQGLFATASQRKIKILSDLGYKRMKEWELKEAGLMPPEEFANMERPPGSGYVLDSEEETQE